MTERIPAMQTDRPMPRLPRALSSPALLAPRRRRRRPTSSPSCSNGSSIPTMRRWSSRGNSALEEAGLDVELMPPADPRRCRASSPPARPISASTTSPTSISTTPPACPLVRFGTLVETPLNSVIVLADGPIKSLADLKGKTVGFSVSGFEDALLGAMLASDGLNARRRRAGQRQLRALGLADRRQGRRHDRRLPQFRADADAARGPRGPRLLPGRARRAGL